MGKRLTALSLQSLKPRATRYEVPDAGARGLYVVVQPSGRKSFCVRYRHGGRPRKLTLDPGLTLARARAAAAAAWVDIERGIDPSEVRQTARVEASPCVGIERPAEENARDRALSAAKAPPTTQTLQPSLFINENKFFPPLVQQVPTKERMLGDNVTSAELKHVLEANAKALRHGGKPTTLGYGTDWATIQERAAERLRVKSEQLKAHEKDRTAAKDRRRRKWNAMDAAIRKDEPDLTKRDRAKKIAAKLGGSWRVIERHIPK